MKDLTAIVKARGGTVSSDALSAQIPAPGHSSRDRSVSLRLTPEGKLMIYCFSATDWRDVREGLIRDGLAGPGDFPGASDTDRLRSARGQGQNRLQAETQPASLEHARLAWSQRTRKFPPVVETYLAARCIAFVRTSTQIAAHGRLALAAHPERQRRHAPCLLARLSSPDGSFAGVQATFLFSGDATNKKLRLIYGRARGAAVRLGEPGEGMLVAEGLETAASAGRIFELPAVAALSAVNLAGLDAPQGLRRLVIAADNDQTGREAAAACRARNSRPGLDIEIKIPRSEGQDWNDAWRAMQ